MIVQRILLASAVAVALFSFGAPPSAIGAPATMDNPDFTQGGQIPAGATHDWNLGPTGARGWIDRKSVG